MIRFRDPDTGRFMSYWAYTKSDRTDIQIVSVHYPWESRQTAREEELEDDYDPESEEYDSYDLGDEEIVSEP